MAAPPKRLGPDVFCLWGGLDFRLVDVWHYAYREIDRCYVLGNGAAMCGIVMAMMPKEGVTR